MDGSAATGWQGLAIPTEMAVRGQVGGLKCSPLQIEVEGNREEIGESIRLRLQRRWGSSGCGLLSSHPYEQLYPPDVSVSLDSRVQNDLVRQSSSVGGLGRERCGNLVVSSRCEVRIGQARYPALVSAYL